MKTRLILITLLLCISATAFSKQRISKSEKKEKSEQEFRKTLALVESRLFRIEVNQAIPQNGMSTERFNPRGSITIKDSVAKGQLPFFGRAYTINPGQSGGIKFDDTMQNSSVKIREKRKNRSILFRFSVRGEGNDTFDIIMDIASNGATSVSVSSTNRSPISYFGELKTIDDNK